MKRFGVVLGLVVTWASNAFAAPEVSLAGQWRFQLDATDAGVTERWCDRALRDQIELPGTLAAQGIGEEVTTNTSWTGTIVDRSWFTAPEYAKYRQPGNVKVSFWLTPEKYYAGAAWYQRDIEIPEKWRGKRVVLSLERPHWETRAWADSTLIGTNNSLAMPHEYDLGQLAPGELNRLARVIEPEQGDGQQATGADLIGPGQLAVAAIGHGHDQARLVDPEPGADLGASIAHSPVRWFPPRVWRRPHKPR